MNRALGVIAAVTAFFVAGAVLPNGLPLGVVVLGVVLGSLQALTALGLVLLYRSSRIINLAQAEIGGLAAAAAVVLVAGKGLPYFVAVPIGLIVAALTGALIDATVVRRLFTAPRLIVMVATIGLAQIVGAAEIAMPHLFSKLKPFTTFHAPFSVTMRVGPLVFGADHLMAVVVATVALGGLWWFLVRSNLGIAVRAAADSQERAATLGIPIRRLSRVTWIIAAVLSGAGAMFSAPILGTNLGVAAGPVALLVPLAAAVIGRMDNLVRTALAAVALSVFQQGVFWSYPRSSVVDVGLFLFVLSALVGQRRQASREDDTELGSYVAARQPRPVPRSIAALPEVRWAKALSLALFCLASGLLLLTLSQSHLVLASYIAIYGIVAISLVVLTGWSGQISLGQFAFVAVGAGVAGGLYVNAGVDLSVALLSAIVVGALAAVLVGAPALRLPGHLLAAATLAFAIPVSTWLLNPDNFPALTPRNIVRPTLFGRIALSSPRTFAATCFVAVALAWILMANLRRSRAGRAILGVRDNERAAAAYGIDPTRTRLVAFGTAGALCGLAGALYALALRGIGFAGFDPAESIQAFTMVVVGGLGSLGTALLGATYVRGAQYFVHGAAQLLATGAGLLLLLLVVPGGLGSIVTGVRDRYIRWVAGRHGIDLAQGTPAPPAATPVADGQRIERALLRVRGVDAGYGAVQVLFDTSLEVGRGEVLALLGTNGAGKSTLLKVIAGLLPADKGAIEFDDSDLRHSDAAERARCGIALMPGGRAIFPSLTVAENLRVGDWLHRGDPTDALTLFPALADRLATRAGLLSGGQQQMLGLAMSLRCRPELLLIDELSLGLAPAIVSQLIDAVGRINAEGTTVVVVEQSLNVAASIAGRAVFLERGAVRFDGRTEDLLDRSDLARSVFLTSASPPTRAPARAGSSLEVRGLCVSFGGITALDEVDLSVPANQIVGVIGSNGAGKTTLLDCISGFLRPRAGTITLDGDDVTTIRPAARALRGLGRSFQGARLFPTLTVTETLALACERHAEVREPFASAFALAASRRSEAALRDRVDDLVDRVQLGGYRNACISELSTGTRRIVELACALAHEPDVLLLDEPSTGLAQRETETLRDTLAELRDVLGVALVIVEHDIPLISSLADQLVCLHLGTVLASGPPREVLDDPAVIASYLGTDEATIARDLAAERLRPGGPIDSYPSIARGEVTMTARSVVGYDPFDAAVVEDPYPIYAWLRDEAPMHHAPVTNTYVLSRYEDVAWALAETDLLSSDAMRGVLLGQPTGTGDQRLPREAAMGTLVSVDPPAHTELRRIVNRGFTPRRITSWQVRIDELAADLLAPLRAGERYDIIGGVAAPLPVRVIAELLGADIAQADQFRTWADSLTRVMSGSRRAAVFDEDSMQAVLGLASYLAEQIEARHREPRDDLLTVLVRAQGDDVLAHEEAIGFAALLLFAGTETTTNLIGNAIWALLGDADQLHAAIDDRGRVGAVLEETLRWESPVQYVFRRATAPFERHGVEVPVDAVVTLVLGAANRDPAHWGGDAAVFNPDRETSGHAAFGFGPHFCLGAALARAEANAVVDRLLDHLEGCEVINRGDEYIDSLQFRGRRRLEIRSGAA